MLSTLFLNLPVHSVARSIEFFGGLGFTFNEQFTDETAACMVVNESINVMLCEHAKFQGFIDKAIATPDTTEAILSFQCQSAAEVSRIAEKAFDLGARKINELDDQGFMISWGFEDLDGHLWDLFWFNPEAAN